MKIDRLKRKRAKRDWLKGMRKLYPDFKAKMWGRDSYRLNYPQP